MTTEELLIKCINKDHSAWDEFTRRYKGLVTKSVKYKLNRLDKRLLDNEIPDIVQEIFLLIWEKDKLQRVQSTACLKGWLAIVSINVTSNYFKKRILRSVDTPFSLDEHPSPEDPELTLEAMIPSHQSNTAQMVESNELNNIIDGEISKLVTKQQLALRFNLYDGKKQRDIARIMNIPNKTVATLIRRAKNRLRKNLKETLATLYK